MQSAINTIIVTVCVLLQIATSYAQAPLRRPLSPTTPMFLYQVQQTDPEDPQACINSVPADVRPYTVMEYCMGAEGGAQTNGYAFADYFCNVCQQNGVWCMFQCSSGDANTMNNLSIADYQALFQKYPNLIGFSFAEQNYGFVTTSSEWGPSSFSDRLNLFSNLLPLCNQYGTYLYVSEMQSISNPEYDPIAKFKASPAFANATRMYKSNYIVGDKFTSGRGYYDNESVTLGVYLSGHAGNYAVRFDETAWGSAGYTELYGLQNPTVTNGNTGFSTPEAAHGIPIVDHMLLQGATVLDGPEFPEYSTINLGRVMPCYSNTTCDIFRKILDGTIQIPSLSNVLANTPIAYVCDQNDNVTGGPYETGIYDGLYMMDGDGVNNHTWFKSSGRYSSIPAIYTNAAYELSGFSTNVLQSQYTNRWPTFQAKMNEFNDNFPSYYSTNNSPFFAALRGNRWFTYNPYLDSNVTVSATLNLQYNTCSNLFLQYPPQTFAVITESNQSLQIYFNNYFTDKDGLWVSNNVNQTTFLNNFLANPTDDTTNTIRTTIFQISGCTNVPTYTLTDRGIHPVTTNSSTFANGVFTLTLTGNGPCDIIINCSGNAVRTNTAPARNVMVPPANYVPDVPAPPAVVTAMPGYGQATLSWSATNCLYYNIKRGTSINGPFTNIAVGVTNSVNLYSDFVNGTTVYNTTLNYTDSGLTASNTYYYVVSAVNASGEGANSAVTSVTMVPVYAIGDVADSYVQDGGSANNNYGTLPNLNVKNGGGVNNGFNRVAYLKFNVRGLTNAQNVQLVLMPYWVTNSGTTYTSVANTLAFEWVTNDNWTETGITWNDQPAGVPVALTNLTAIYTVESPVSVNIPNSVMMSQAANDGYLSMMVTSVVSTVGLIQFCSKEFLTNAWQPALTYTLPSTLPPIINSFSLAGGQPQISISGEPNGNYTLLTSTNLVNWQALFTTNLIFFPYTMVDTNLTANSARFYRIQIGP